MKHKTMKEFEMVVTGVTSEEWDRQAAEARQARTEILSEYQNEIFALYDAGKLMIGCAEKPIEVICYGRRGFDGEIWGVKVSTLNRQAEKAYSLEW